MLEAKKQIDLKLNDSPCGLWCKQNVNAWRYSNDRFLRLPQLNDRLVKDKISSPSSIDTGILIGCPISCAQAVAELTSQQKWWRFYEQLRRGSYRRRYQDDSLSDLEARANQRIASLADVTTRLTEDFPDLKAKLVEVRASLNF